MTLKVNGSVSPLSSLQGAERQLEVRVFEGQKKAEELAFEWAFNLGRKYQDLISDKQILEKEKLFLEHEITELKVLHEAEWLSTFDKAKASAIHIADKIRLQIEPLQFFLDQSKSNSLSGVLMFLDQNYVHPITHTETLHYLRTAGAHTAVFNRMAYFTDWEGLLRAFKVNPLWETHPLYKKSESITSLSIAVRITAEQALVTPEISGEIEGIAGRFSEKINLLESEVLKIRVIVDGLRASNEKLKSDHKKLLDQCIQETSWNIFDRNIEIGNTVIDLFVLDKEKGVTYSIEVPNKANIEIEVNHGFRERMSLIIEQFKKIVVDIEAIKTSFEASIK